MGSERKVYSVAEVNRKARMVLESGIGEVWVEGELTDVKLNQSGHWYFTLKDENASISCAMFVRENASVSFAPKNGIKVEVFASPSVYEVRGQFQLKVQKMEKAGKGNLQEQFEKLKAKLAVEGLFDADRKNPLPLLPRKIGVVTSPSGAAIRDIINVLTRRYPNVHVLLAPVHVQGKGAETKIAKAIDYLNTRDDIDVMIVGRGGGSIEDLWNFNEEIVARAIYRSEIPVISAVGHEIDFTIADFVADVRAPTPSAAAELAVREKGELEDAIALCDRRLRQSLKTVVQDYRLRLNRQVHSYVFREPGNLVRQYRRDIDRIETRMAELLKMGAQQHARRLEGANARMGHLLESSVQQTHQRIDELGMTMRHRMERKTDRERQRLQRMDGQLRMLNPLAVLGRGYSLTRKSDGSVVRSVASVKIGEDLVTQFVDGKVISNVAGKE